MNLKDKINYYGNLTLNVSEKTRDTIDELGKTIAKKNGLPFEIRISFGAVEFNSEQSDLNTLITLADKEQYIEKRKHHAGRK